MDDQNLPANLSGQPSGNPPVPAPAPPLPPLPVSLPPPSPPAPPPFAPPPPPSLTPAADSFSTAPSSVGGASGIGAVLPLNHEPFPWEATASKIAVVPAALQNEQPDSVISAPANPVANDSQTQISSQPVSLPFVSPAPPLPSLPLPPSPSIPISLPEASTHSAADVPDLLMPNPALVPAVSPINEPLPVSAPPVLPVVNEWPLPPASPVPTTDDLPLVQSAPLPSTFGVPLVNNELPSAFPTAVANPTALPAVSLPESSPLAPTPRTAGPDDQPVDLPLGSDVSNPPVDTAAFIGASIPTLPIGQPGAVAPAPLPSPSVQPPVPSAATILPEEPKKGGWLKWTVIGILAVTIVFGIFYFYSIGKRANNGTSNVTDTTGVTAIPQLDETGAIPNTTTAGQ